MILLIFFFFFDLIDPQSESAFYLVFASNQTAKRALAQTIGIHNVAPLIFEFAPDNPSQAVLFCPLRLSRTHEECTA
jgi:ABC-type uncharacterized transport system involved in gliding motility auxiliary subunit